MSHSHWEKHYEKQVPGFFQGDPKCLHCPFVCVFSSNPLSSIITQTTNNNQRSSKNPVQLSVKLLQTLQYFFEHRRPPQPHLQATFSTVGKENTHSRISPSPHNLLTGKARNVCILKPVHQYIHKG